MVMKAYLLFSFSLIVQSINAGIPISVMMPLNLVSNGGVLNNPSQLQAELTQLKQGGVDGVMTDLWWGIVEQQPQQYNWEPYYQFATICQSVGLTLQVVMSFHQCGTNVGDACFITLPSWVLSVGNSNNGIFYTDSQGGTDQEYLSMGVDNQPIFSGRSAVQIYSDFMNSFSSNFSNFFPSTINQVQVGLGPAGEMRYPAYQLQNNKWSYCGIGEFQCYDPYMLSALSAAANASGNPLWGGSGPNDAGTYDSQPSDTGFFSDNNNDNYQSPYGQFFLGWYSSMLLQHGANILSQAQQIFSPHQVSIAAKVAGIHWWYLADNHAAECTAGYFNTDGNNAYLQIAQMLAQYGAVFDFTCLEMTDPSGCDSGPQELVKQSILAANSAGVGFSGENALPICDPTCSQSSFNNIYEESTQYGNIERFTYLRMDSNLFQSSNWAMFTGFVQQMANA